MLINTCIYERSLGFSGFHVPAHTSQALASLQRPAVAEGCGGRGSINVLCNECNTICCWVLFFQGALRLFSFGVLLVAPCPGQAPITGFLSAPEVRA